MFICPVATYSFFDLSETFIDAHFHVSDNVSLGPSVCFAFYFNHKGGHFRDGIAEKQKEGTYI